MIESDSGGAGQTSDRKLRHATRYTKIYNTFSLLVTAIPLVLALVVETPSLPITLVLLCASIAFGWVHALRLREATRFPGRPISTARAVIGLGFSLVVWALGVTTGPMGFIWCFVVGATLAGILIGRPWRHNVGWIVVGAASTLVVGLVAMSFVDPPEGAQFWFRPATGAFLVSLVWVTDFDRLWWFKSVVDLDESLRTADELATARERLRIADDLHDILGHALEVVAFKSELAARLVTVDAVRAEAEMAEVQKVARASLSEVRSLVQERRPTDLVTELAGARAVLESAGITAIVTAEPAALPVDVRNVLGRVLREAMTNLLRHAEPTRCWIELSYLDGSVALLVVNDGVVPGLSTMDGAVSRGTGLASLRRYLAVHGGGLTAGPGENGFFRVEAVVPAAAVAEARA